MADVTRRQFLRTASIGAAAAGVLSTTGVAVFSAVDADASSLPKAAPITGAPLASGADIFAHVADASTGTITVFHGAKTYSVTDPSIAAALARVTQ